MEGANNHIVPGQSPEKSPRSDVRSVSTGADTLFKWAGSFWREVYEDDGLVGNLQVSRAARLSQMYLDVVEALRLCDRENAPAFHRERWYPIRIHKADRNMGSSGVLKFGSGEVVFGEQESELYPEGTVFTVGSKKARFKDFSVYPVEKGLDRVVSCIVDGIVSPKVFLRPGVDFMVSGGSLVIRSDMDPFNPDYDGREDERPFPVFEDPYLDESDGGKYESVLWACDASVDRDLVQDHIGYAVGLPGNGDIGQEQYKRIANSVWNTLSEGATPKAFQALIASLCGIPFVLSDGEVVESVVDDEGVKVVTSRNVYAMPSGTSLPSRVKPGAVLGRFDLLDDSVHVYPYVVNVDRVDEYSEFDVPFREDVPVIDIPPALIRSGVENGFYVGWGERPLVCAGFDANMNPKLRFSLEGSDFDNDTFWSEVWVEFERGGVSMASLLKEFLYPEFLDSNGNPVPGLFSAGTECGSITPIKFFLRQLVGANTLIVTVRTDNLPDSSPLLDYRFFRTVSECLPSHVRMYFIEHCGVETEGYGLSNEDGVSEDVSETVWDEEYDDARFDARAGFRCSDKLVSSRYVARCVDKDEFDEYD